jgi:hypothetical protein
MFLLMVKTHHIFYLELRPPYFMPREKKKEKVESLEGYTL